MISIIRALFYLLFPVVYQTLNALLYYLGFKVSIHEHAPLPSLRYLLSLTLGTAVFFIALYSVMSLIANPLAFSALFPAIFEPSQGIVMNNIFKGTIWMVLVTCLAHIFIISSGTLVGLKRSTWVIIIGNICSYIITFGILRFIA